MITPEDEKRISDILGDLVASFKAAIEEIPANEREAVFHSADILNKAISGCTEGMSFEQKQRALLLHKIIRCAAYLQNFYHQLGLGLTIGIKKDGTVSFVSYPLDPKTAAIEKRDISSLTNPKHDLTGILSPEDQEFLESVFKK